MLPGTPISVSLESYLLPMRFSFTILSKNVMHIDVRKTNTRVWKWHELCGAIFIREDDLDRYYDYTSNTYLIAETMVCKLIE